MKTLLLLALFPSLSLANERTVPITAHQAEILQEKAIGHFKGLQGVKARFFPDGHDFSQDVSAYVLAGSCLSASASVKRATTSLLRIAQLSEEAHGDEAIQRAKAIVLAETKDLTGLLAQLNRDPRSTGTGPAADEVSQHCRALQHLFARQRTFSAMRPDRMIVVTEARSNNSFKPTRFAGRLNSGVRPLAPCQ